MYLVPQQMKTTGSSKWFVLLEIADVVLWLFQVVQVTSDCVRFVIDGNIEIMAATLHKTIHDIFQHGLFTNRNQGFG